LRLSAGRGEAASGTAPISTLARRAAMSSARPGGSVDSAGPSPASGGEGSEASPPLQARPSAMRTPPPRRWHRHPSGCSWLGAHAAPTWWLRPQRRGRRVPRRAYRAGWPMPPEQGPVWAASTACGSWRSAPRVPAAPRVRCTTSVDLSPIETVAGLWCALRRLSGQIRRIEVILSGDADQGDRA
jgi:hypothetical protein